MPTEKTAITGRVKRRYESRLRAAQAELTRGAVLEAARDLLSERGWAETGMREIAARAGVAVETIYANVGSKVDVLLAALEAAAAAEDPAVRLLERPEIRVLAEGDFRARAAAGARLAASGNARTVGLHKAFREGAASDPALTQPFAEYMRQRRREFTEVAELVAGRRVDRRELEGLWAVLSRDVFELLVDHCGWTVRRYQRWAETMILRTLEPIVDPKPA